MRMEGKLTNAEGEFIASGLCEVNLDKAEVTMWPSFEAHMLERERGELSLELGDGRQHADQRQAPDLQAAGRDGAAHVGVPAAHPRSVPEHLAAGYSDTADADDDDMTMPPQVKTVEHPQLRIVPTEHGK